MIDPTRECITLNACISHGDLLPDGIDWVNGQRMLPVRISRTLT